MPISVNGKDYYLGRALFFNYEKQLCEVQWFNGTKQNYRAGYENFFDLYIVDNPLLIEEALKQKRLYNFEKDEIIKIVENLK